MASAPNSSYVACFPLQEQIFDKDLNVPLAAGVVSFFEDEARTVPKNVYYLTGGPPPADYNFTILGINGVVTLSSIGTFVDGSGNNIIPFLWPYVGDPSVDEPTDPESYYITVYSSSGTEQFTVQNWPPNSATATPSPAGTTTTKVTPYTIPGAVSWVPQTKTLYATFECMGGGGGGGGSANSASGGISVGGGGGGGGYSRTTVTSPTTQTVTVGSFGVGGASGAHSGTAGGVSSVGILCIANGGSGGGYGGGTIAGQGGVAGTGDVAGSGAQGLGGIYSASAGYYFIPSGYGANTQWGSGAIAASSTQQGGDASGYGAGGGGGLSIGAAGAVAGGNGAPGFVLITEYLSS